MFRLKEAFLRAKQLGLVKTKREISMEMWPNSSKKAAYVNFLNLEQGASKSVKIEHVEFLCKRLDCSIGYLFGMSNVPSAEEVKRGIVEKAQQIIDGVNTL